MLIRGVSRTLMAAVVAVPLLAAGVADGRAEEGAGLPWQLLHYNHAYGVLDHETADAVEHSAYLRRFADFELRTTTGDEGQTWTGSYLLGRETYLELFKAGDLPGQDSRPGSGGLALSTEHANELPEVTDELRDEGVAAPIEFSQTRDFGDGRPVPWFDSVLTTQQYDTFGAWAMEYRPEYFADPRSETEPPSHPGDVGRERYLPDDYRRHLMRDVTGVRIAVTAQDLANTVPLLRAGDFVVLRRHGGVVAHGKGTTLRFDVVPAHRTGLRQVEMSLNRAPGYRHEERLGRSVLVVGPAARAVWTFGSPHGRP
ncbi:DUF5829 family protein [Actinophytocola glycyrrhizae]|uniref:DUF5829 family protein n=1 Tax=Actinophytocola glycyrrhizae TaxID=2044873 RepID=A0ABV9RTV4_9PSEU